MAFGRFWQLNVVRPIVCSGTPSQSVIELAVDLVALLDHVITHLADLGALEFDLVLRTEGFDHRIEALTGPRDELTKAMDGDPLMAFAETVVGTLKLLTLGLRL
jgi:hypothetical protein